MFSIMKYSALVFFVLLVAASSRRGKVQSFRQNPANEGNQSFPARIKLCA